MMGDFTVYSSTNDITYGAPTLSGCQYQQQSVLTYNVSATIPQTDFRCETGGTSTTCGHSSAIAANYTINRCKFQFVRFTFLLLYTCTDTGQKYSHASNFPYIFHIKLQFFRSLS
jgi:hypothetical protein